MIRKTVYSLLLIGLLSSCASAFGVVGLGSKMKKLELGMTKEETLNVLGNSYDVIATSQTPEGKLEIFRFYGMNTFSYSTYFLDGKLVEWHEGEPRTDSRERIIIKETNR